MLWFVFVKMNLIELGLISLYICCGMLMIVCDYWLLFVLGVVDLVLFEWLFVDYDVVVFEY